MQYKVITTIKWTVKIHLCKKALPVYVQQTVCMWSALTSVVSNNSNLLTTHSSFIVRPQTVIEINRKVTSKVFQWASQSVSLSFLIWCLMVPCGPLWFLFRLSNKCSSLDINVIVEAGWTDPWREEHLAVAKKTVKQWTHEQKVARND